MPYERRVRRIRLVLNGLWAAMAVAMVAGLARSETALPDRNALYLLERGIQRGDIQIYQPNRLEKLSVRISPYDSLALPDYRVAARPDVRLDEHQWQRVHQLVARFVAAENQAQAQVFQLESRPGQPVGVAGFDAKLFEYQNPFANAALRNTDRAVIDGSSVGSAAGWSVLGPGFLLTLNPSAPTPEVVIDLNSADGSPACQAAQRAVLVKGEHRIRVAVGQPPVRTGPEPGRRSRVVLQLSRQDSTGTWGQPAVLDGGEYFVFGGETYTAFDHAAPRAPGAESGVHLMFSKSVNGRSIRYQPLGSATSNLLGVGGGGYADGLDGAIRHDAVSRVQLSVDPEFQFCAWRLLDRELATINALAPLPRRRASVTVLDMETGGVLAQVGLPSRALPEETDRRRIRVPAEMAYRDPATEAHMSGSTVKVLSVGLGYLLFGHARSQLLPASNNDLAIQQAFEDAYNAQVGAQTLDGSGRVTAAFRQRFGEAGGPGRVSPEFTRALQEVFRVSPVASANSPRARLAQPIEEAVVPQGLLRFFDQQRLRQNVFPETSRFPLLDAEMVGVFRNYSLGGQDTRFTTLRLASVLATVSGEKVFAPYLVSGVADRASHTYTPDPRAVSDIELPGVHGSGRFKAVMVAGMQSALHRVLLPGGTGHFFAEQRAGGPLRRQYLGLDDPTTPQIREKESRAGDIGKSGTATYDDGKLQDSLFLYRHGRFVVAVWIERSDLEAEKTFLRHPAHRFTHGFIQWLEGNGYY